MAKNANRAKRKCHTNIFVFHNLDLKIVPIDAELNSPPGKQSFFSKIVAWYLEKKPNLKKWFEI